jgi:transcriptional regulator
LHIDKRLCDGGVMDKEVIKRNGKEWGGMSLNETARALGITRDEVVAIERRAIRKIKKSKLRLWFEDYGHKN